MSYIFIELWIHQHNEEPSLFISKYYFLYLAGWDYRGRLVTWLRVRFTRSHTKCHLVKKKKLLFDGRTHQNVSRTACLREAAKMLLLVGKKSRTVEHGSTVALFTLMNSFFFLNKKHGKKFSFFPLEKSVQLIDFTRIVHVTINNIVFFKKLF